VTRPVEIASFPVPPHSYGETRALLARRRPAVGAPGEGRHLRGRAARRSLVLLMVLAAATALVAGDHGAALCFSPLIVLVSLLLTGSYPGAHVLVRIRKGPRQMRRPRRSSPVRRAPERARRVGLEIAFALAMRPPPSTF